MSLLIAFIGKKGHAMLIVPEKVERLVGIQFCPDCHQPIGKYDGNYHAQRTLDRHRKYCNGEFKQKTLKLDKIEKPYCPHILKNKVYMYCLAHNIEYEPIRYYITFDFETMEDKVETAISDKTIINSFLQPLSVSSTIKSKAGIKTIYHDVREEEFIQTWLVEVFNEAREMRKDNLIKDVPLEIQCPHNEFIINVIGFNSSKFDMNILFSELSSDAFKVKSFLGSTTSFKQVLVSKTFGKKKPYQITLRFIDAKLLAGGGSLKDFVKNFGSEGCSNKGIFPYEAVNVNNYNDVLSKSIPFDQKDFHSVLNQSDINDEDYKDYVEDAKRFINRWEYLRHYNELDTQIMISPIDNIIDFTWEYKVDALRNLSLSANASAIKYAIAYKDFKVRDYIEEKGKYVLNLTKSLFEKMCKGYLEQDKKAKRDTSKNITVKDYDEINERFKHNPHCWICGKNIVKELTFDRIDNNKSHTKDNIMFACKTCNVLRGKRDYEETRLVVQLRNYCLEHNLPMTLTDEKAVKIIREGITGGLSIVHHRVNIKDETYINHLKYEPAQQASGLPRETESGKVISYNTPYKMTHVCGTDFNSLYPSSFSSQYNENIPYTGHKMYMAGKLNKVIEVNKDNFNRVYEMIHSDNRFNEKGQLFIATVKGHIPEKYWNEFINFPPIIRNYEVETTENNIGSYMYNYMKENGFKTDSKERKLTQLLKVDKFTAFSSYYLWFLIDRCHFVIDDIETVLLFDKHDGFNAFVNEFMNNRIKAKLEHNVGKEMFFKTSLNGSYGYDGKNTEKYTKSVIKDKDGTFTAQLYPSFVDSRKIGDNKYLVSYNPDTYTVDTCIQEAFFTLDNAKYWYLNFIYNFMYKCFDMDKIHYVEGDTDSAYWAISGNPEKDYTQRFDYVIKDKEFYDKHVYDYFPNPEKDIYDEKKLLGLAIEKEGENCIALCSKCYSIWNNDGTTKSLKLKGVSLKKNKIVSSDYEKALKEPIKGKNINLQLNRDSQMSKITINKNALSAVNTKMIVLSNGCCCVYPRIISKRLYYSIEN